MTASTRAVVRASRGGGSSRTSQGCTMATSLAPGARGTAPVVAPSALARPHSRPVNAQGGQEDHTRPGDGLDPQRLAGAGLGPVEVEVGQGDRHHDPYAAGLERGDEPVRGRSAGRAS